MGDELTGRVSGVGDRVTGPGHPTPDPRSPTPEALHLVLVGLPGVGKTTVGRRVAELLGRPFLDFDEELQRRTGKLVAELFEERGETGFRALELELTRELAGRPAMVLSPGGGWIGVEEGVALFRPCARIIYLRARPETVVRRMGAAIANRPLLQATDPVAAVHDLLGRRELLYLGADAVLDTEMLEMEEVALRLAALADPPRAG